MSQASAKTQVKSSRLEAEIQGGGNAVLPIGTERSKTQHTSSSALKGKIWMQLRP